MDTKENWAEYGCLVDEKPAVVMTDLDLSMSAPLSAFPVLGYISVALTNPDDEGLASEEERRFLDEIEDAFAEALAGAEGVYAGSCQTDGRFDLFYYIASAEGWVDKAAMAAEASGKKLDVEAGAESDPAWETYFDFLFPDEDAMLDIQNRRALSELLERGDDIEASRPIEHLAGFPAMDDASAFAEALREEGYAVNAVKNAAESWEEAAEDDYEVAFQVSFSHVGAPAQIAETSFSLSDLARTYGGLYLGWAAPAANAGEDENDGGDTGDNDGGNEGGAAL